MNIFSRLKKFILDLIFPVNCLGCGRDDLWICPQCLDKIPLNRELVCPVCRRTTGGPTCPSCREKTYLSGLLVAADYQLPLIQSLIHTFKYNYIEALSLPLGGLLAKYASEFDKRLDPPILKNPDNLIITAVPLHKKRFLERGFNQSELLAKAAAVSLPGKFLPKLLKRKKYTEQQAKLKKRQRRKNLKNAFCLSRSLDLSGKNVIIIDDVATTLTTLNECAGVLKKAGCQNVWGLVIARSKQ